MKKRQIKIDVPGPVAAKLEMYLYLGEMILGPRGWKCQSAADGFVGGVDLLPPDEKDQSQITENFVAGVGTPQTMENMDTYLNAYFPDQVKKEILMGDGPDTTEAYTKYVTDILKYPSPLLMTYVTPANHLGLGNDTLEEGEYTNEDGDLVKPLVKLPIQGFMKPVLESEGWTYQIDIFAIALPKSMFRLIPYIFDYAETIN